MASPIRVRVHSTRNVASSRALARGASWQDFYGPLCTYSSGSTVSDPSGLIQSLPALTNVCAETQPCGQALSSGVVFS